MESNFCCHTEKWHIVSITRSASPDAVTQVSSITSPCRRGKTSNTNAKRRSENETQRRPWSDRERNPEKVFRSFFLKFIHGSPVALLSILHPHNTEMLNEYSEWLRGRWLSFHACRSIASTARRGLRNAMRPVKGVPRLAILAGKTETTFAGK